MKAEDGKLTIQQAARAIGLSEDTLRYYERIGLIHPIDRAENSHRRYSAQDLGWIEFLTKLRATGMPIKQMLAYAKLQRASASLREYEILGSSHRFRGLTVLPTTIRIGGNDLALPAVRPIGLSRFRAQLRRHAPPDQGRQGRRG